VLAWTGDKAAACTAIQHALVTSGNFNVHVFKNSPAFFPLKGDPKFEAILNDPKNNQPLF
jgi:hypothetical protein